MNRRPQGLKAQKTIQGFLQFKSAEGLSRRTVEQYQRDLDRWLEYQEDMDISQITPQELRQFLGNLLTEYRPHRLSGKNDTPLRTYKK